MCRSFEKAVLARPFPWIAKGSEDDVGQGYVAVIVRVYPALVVDQVALGALQDIADPMGRTDVGVLKHAGNCGDYPDNESGVGAQAKNAHQAKRSQ